MAAIDRSGVRILYVQYTNPAGYPPLEHSSQILAESGFQVLFLGSAVVGAPAMSFPVHRRIQVRQLAPVGGGWRGKLHYLFFCAWVVRWLLMWRPTWIYASDLLACPPALLASWLLGTHVIYHEHDWPVESKSRFGKLCFAARRTLARRADRCVLPNQERAALFIAQLCVPDRKVILVWNCPRKSEVAGPRTALLQGQLRIVYHGSIVPARVPLALIDALAVLPDGVRLQIVGYETAGHRGHLRALQSRATELGMADRLEYLPAVPRHQVLTLGRSTDLGLALIAPEDHDLNLRTMGGASNKPFEYLACGLAVLVSDLPDLRRMYVEPGYGLACNPLNPDSIREALRWFLEHPVEMRRMGEVGRRRIVAEWNYETQFEPVLRRLSTPFNRADPIAARNAR